MVYDMSKDVQSEAIRTDSSLAKMLGRADSLRESSIYRSGSERRSQIGQFLTPIHIAQMMAEMFTLQTDVVHLLDPGAGAGILSAATIAALIKKRNRPKTVHVTAFENDKTIHPFLQYTFDDCFRVCQQSNIEFHAAIIGEDFIHSACATINDKLFSKHQPRFNAVILNPPYKKIASASPTRLALRSIGIEATNLYSAFVALSTLLLQEDGEMVAITPRSFCNGPYFRAFRRFFFDRMALTRLHVFSSRSTAFSNDEVLQENVILHACRTRHMPASVTISTTNGKSSDKIKRIERPYSEVLSPSDPDYFVHIVTDKEQVSIREQMARFTHSLEEIGLSVSTGRVVDFRALDFIKKEQAPNVVPLIYPCHFGDGFIVWPRSDVRKPNYIVNTPNSASLLVDSDLYVLVKRFSAKEEKRRITACIYDPSRISARFVGFENHLNYFHEKGRGLPRDLAKGIATFLNSGLVDSFFRQFNGHTQVNASDLRKLRYPSRKELIRLGERINGNVLAQEDVDQLLGEIKT